MRFDKHDNPQVRADGVEVGPSSQMPVSVGTGVDTIVQGTRDIAHAGMIVIEEQKKAASAKARLRELQFAEEASAVEASHRRENGEGALDTAPFHERIETLRNEYGSDLEGDAYDEYEARTKLRKLSITDGIEKHAADARVKIYGAIADKALDTMKKEAISNYNSPEKIELSLKLGLSTMMEYLSGHLKLPNDVVDATLEKAQAQVYEAALSEYAANKQFSAGSRYLSAIKDALGEEAPKWETAFNKLTDAAESEALAVTAWNTVRSEATDTVTGRFNPDLAREAFDLLYSPEDRARVRTDVEKQINVAKAAQDEADNQRRARLVMDHRKTGRLDRTSIDFTQLDDVGRNAAEHDADVADRIKANDTKEKNLQRTVNRIGLANFWALGDTKKMVGLTEDQLYILSPGMDAEGVAEIKKEQGKLRIAADKRSLATADFFNMKVSKIKPLISKRYNERIANDFVAEVSSWWATESQGDKPVEKQKVNEYIGDLLLMLDYTWPSDNKPKFMTKNQAERTGAIPVLPIEDQVFEEAKALLRGDYKREAEAEAGGGGGKTGADWMKEIPELAGKLKPDAVYDREGRKFIERKK